MSILMLTFIPGKFEDESFWTEWQRAPPELNKSLITLSPSLLI
jgi:hypothetical protein